MTTTSNGYNGQVSTKNPDSVLARLVAFVELETTQGRRASRTTFVEAERVGKDADTRKPSDYAKIPMTVAIANGYLCHETQAGKPVRLSDGSKALVLGPKASLVRTYLDATRR
jgi:hypothetical protein